MSGARIFVASVSIAAGGKELTPAWQMEVEGTVVRLLAGADRLIAVTREGRLYCLGADKSEVIRHEEKRAGRPGPGRVDDQSSRHPQNRGQPRRLWRRHGVGHAPLRSGAGRHSQLHLIGLDKDDAKVRPMRQQLDANGLYGSRVALLTGGPGILLPPYFASVVVVEADWLKQNFDSLPVLYNTLRPFGGTAYFLRSEGDESLRPMLEAAKLARAEITETSSAVVVRRQGPLPESANWTHEHGDASNTRVSKDKLVKAPLGLLWFGGPSNEGVLPRHGHGPQPQVIDGRLIIEGVDLLRAIDIYTGRLLWETKLPGVGDFYNNVSHQPGANASGSNVVSTRDGIYVVYGKSCLRLDPASGERISDFQLPISAEQKETPLWGYLNVIDDYLIGGADPILERQFSPVCTWSS